MFIITGPSTLYPEMIDKAEPFTRLFERFDLEPFDLEGTKELIEKPLKAERISLQVSDKVVEKIHAITEGHPYFITLVMRDLINKKQDGNLDSEEFSKSYPDLIDHFARVKFDNDLSKATDSEKEILFKMAKTQKTEITLKNIGSPSAKFLERLVKKDLVIKIARGKYCLYNPLFKAYLKKKVEN